MWVNKKEWREIKDRLYSLENVATKFYVIDKTHIHQLDGGISYHEHKGITIHDVIEELLKFLNIKIEYVGDQSHLQVVKKQKEKK